MKEYWKGNKPLWKAFWLIWVLGAIAIPTAITIPVYVFAPLFQISAIQLSIATYIFLFIFNPYFVFSWVVVWRCSNNTNAVAANYIAKALVSLHISFFTFNIYTIITSFEAVS